MKKMEIIREKEEMRSLSRSMRRAGLTIALVPTMGCLHAGHLSLVEEAKRRADVVVVSIYVNPTQFGPSEDFNTYPRDIHGDLSKLQPLGVDAVFNPHDLYVRDASPHVDDIRQSNNLVEVNGHETWVRVERLEQPLCGKSRPIFFQGVATVVMKLFHIVEPDVAVFGKKDYQQWKLICRMVRDLDIPVEIIGGELLRESDGLAMSSRNLYLSHVERKQALSIISSLRKVEEEVANGNFDTSTLINLVKQEIMGASGKVDYVEIVDQKALQPLSTIDRPAVLCIAAWFGRVRLIDNIELQP